MDEEADTPREMMTVCPTCRGAGHVPAPTLAVLDGEPQSVLAPHTCRQCRDSDRPGWLAGFLPPV